MTIALTTINSVRQRVKARLSSGVGAAEASATARKLFDVFLESLQIDQVDQDLQFVNFGDIGSGLTTAVTSPCRVYAVYGKKQADSGTDAFLKVRNNATDVISIPFQEASKEAIFFSPTGVVLATDLKLESHTDSTGSTDSTATHGPQGFVIVGSVNIGGPSIA